MKKYIPSPRFGIRCYPNAWWIGRFTAITWFGTIHFNCSREELARRMSSPFLAEVERHERIHILQAKSFRTRYLGFYLVYLWYWVGNLIRYRDKDKAYRQIPFELEAYANEDKLDYPVSHWRDYRPTRRR